MKYRSIQIMPFENEHKAKISNPRRKNTWDQIQYEIVFNGFETNKTSY